ncbi:MAG: transposase [Pirellulales bacterium]|nr:transposase [Pirellulales bacterium]
MAEPELKINRRRLPHWTLDGSAYFVTFRVIGVRLSASERQVVLDHLRSGHGRFYDLAAAMVMPDHTHLILKPRGDLSLSRIMKGIKGVSARRVNASRHTSGSLWQDESWDRILRGAAEFDEKLQYMIDNPVKAGLVKNGDLYDGWYFNLEFI